MLAKREVELTLQGVKLRDNPHRTIVAIKGHRRSQEHKDMVESFLEILRPADVSGDEGRHDLGLLDGLERLTDNNCYQSVRLQELTIRAHSTPKELIYQQLSHYLVDVLPSKTSAPPRR